MTLALSPSEIDDATLAAFVDTLGPEEVELLAGDRRPDLGPLRRQRYAEDPEGYARDVLGADEWSPRQRQLAAIVKDAALNRQPCRVLALGGHGTGKSHGVYDLAMWLYDVVAFPDGCDVILTAPGRDSIERTTYFGLVTRGRKAESNGHLLPGWASRPSEGYRGASDKSITWHEGAWRMKAISPRQTAGHDVAHSAGGMHHPNLTILILEEAMGIPQEMISAVEGLAVAQNVIIMATTNPTTSAGYLYGHIQSHREQWQLVEFSQLDHPNVIQRREVHRGSVSHVTLENALRSAEFEERGPADSTALDPSRMDFVYALPPREMPDKPGPRADGIPGHPDAQPRVFRPANAQAAGQHLHGWLLADSSLLLYHVATISGRMASGEWTEPDHPPDQVGIDCAQGRVPVATPRWGPSARLALDALKAVQDAEDARQGSFAAVAAMAHPAPRPAAAQPLITIGHSVELPWTGATPNERARTTADACLARWGDKTLYAVDRAFGGEVGQALEMKGAKVVYVNFGDGPIGTPLELYGKVANRRTEMEVEAAAAFNAGMVSAPYSRIVTQEMEAVGALQLSAKKGAPKIVREKKEIEKQIGRSPDALDSIKLALASEPRRIATWGGYSPWAG